MLKRLNSPRACKLLPNSRHSLHHQIFRIAQLNVWSHEAGAENVLNVVDVSGTEGQIPRIQKSTEATDVREFVVVNIADGADVMNELVHAIVNHSITQKLTQTVERPKVDFIERRQIRFPQNLRYFWCGLVGVRVEEKAALCDFVEVFVQLWR